MGGLRRITAAALTIPLFSCCAQPLSATGTVDTSGEQVAAVSTYRQDFTDNYETAAEAPVIGIDALLELEAAAPEELPVEPAITQEDSSSYEPLDMGSVPPILSEMGAIKQEDESVEPILEQEEITVTYCGTNRELLREYHPEEYAALEAEHPDGLPRCLEGSAPPDSLIQDVPFYNQCDFKNTEAGHEGIRLPCRSGSGPAVLKMAYEYAGLGEQDYDELYDVLWTGSVSGTSIGRVETVLTEEGLLGGKFINLEWEAIRARLEAGHLIHLNLRALRDSRLPYFEERYCGVNCPTGGNHLLIVGITDSELIVHDPYTNAWHPEPRLFGEYLIISRDTVEEKIYDTWNNLLVVEPPGTHDEQPVPTPEGALFEYFPTAWPNQLGPGFGDDVWWQWNNFHNGLDLFGYLGDDIYAMTGGVVVGEGCLKCTNPDTAQKGYGRTIVLYHGEYNGKPLYTIYAHLSEALVKPGDEIQAGELIGLMGNTGFCEPRDRYHGHFSALTENPFEEPWGQYDSEGDYRWLDIEPFLGTRGPL